MRGAQEIENRRVVDVRSCGLPSFLLARFEIASDLGGRRATTSLAAEPTARMVPTKAQLLVFDDLSSALDVHTENQLWDRLFSVRDVTCLVVSHRRAALSRADQILLMSGGRIVDRGSLAELLDRSDEMRRLWVSEPAG